jgi:hypothetical protein
MGSWERLLASYSRVLRRPTHARPVMNPTLYLHIGQGRCGSTSIQRFATEQRAALSERGLSYPSAAEMGLGDHHRGHAAAQTLYQMRGDAPVALAHLAGYLERQENPKVLLSSEWLLNGDADFMRKLVETTRMSGVRLVALAYVREQREWLISRYAQAIKSQRWTISLEEYLQSTYRSRNLDYHAVFSRTAELFGRENLLIRVFERPKLIGGDVRVDAFSVLGIDVGDLVGDDPNANASPSVEELEVMRFLNQRAEPRLFNPRDFLRHSEDFLRQAQWEPWTDLYRLAPPYLLQEMGEHFRTRNEVFRRDFLNDEPAPLFSTRIPADYEPLTEDERLNQRSLELLANHLLRLAERRARKHSKARPRSKAEDLAPSAARADDGRAARVADRKASRAAAKKARRSAGANASRSARGEGRESPPRRHSGIPESAANSDGGGR